MPDLEKLSPLERLALQLSFEAPERRNKYVSEARVTWETIEALRAELERLGFNWRAGSRKTKELERKARAEWRAKYRAPPRDPDPDNLEILREDGAGWFIVRGDDVLAGPFLNAIQAERTLVKMRVR